MRVTDEMVERALDAAGRRGGDLGPIRMRAALEAALRASVEEDRPGLVSAAHGQTAHDAALKIRPRSGTQRARVLDWIEGWGDYGRTRDEVAAELMMTSNAVRPRVRELIQGGHIYVSSKLRRKTDSGCDAEVLISARFPGG